MHVRLREEPKHSKSWQLPIHHFWGEAMVHGFVSAQGMPLMMNRVLLLIGKSLSTGHLRYFRRSSS